MFILRGTREAYLSWSACAFGRNSPFLCSRRFRSHRVPPCLCILWSSGPDGAMARSSLGSRLSSRPAHLLPCCTRSTYMLSLSKNTFIFEFSVANGAVAGHGGILQFAENITYFVLPFLLFLLLVLLFDLDLGVQFREGIIYSHRPDADTWSHLSKVGVGEEGSEGWNTGVELVLLLWAGYSHDDLLNNFIHNYFFWEISITPNLPKIHFLSGIPSQSPQKWGVEAILMILFINILMDKILCLAILVRNTIICMNNKVVNIVIWLGIWFMIRKSKNNRYHFLAA